MNKRYSLSDYDRLLDETFATIRALASVKGGEYSGREDRLANFRRNAAALGLQQEQIWAVYAAKHWDALMSYISNGCVGTNLSEPIAGRVHDLLTYLTLFLAMLEERETEAGYDAHFAKVVDTNDSDEIPF